MRLQLAKHFAAEVTRVDGAAKLDMPRSIGADHVINFAELDFTGTGEVYDVVFDVIGFWLSSFLMLLLTSVCLTLDKTRKNVGLAVVVPLVACVGAYFLFTHVFYVPFPEPTWWPGLG